MDDKILSMKKNILSMDEIIYPSMGKSHPWIESFYPWIKKSSVKKNSGRSFYPWRSSMDMTDDAHGCSLTLQSTE